MSVYIYIYVYLSIYLIYLFMFIYIYVYIYIYIHVYMRSIGKNVRCSQAGIFGKIPKLSAALRIYHHRSPQKKQNARTGGLVHYEAQALQVETVDTDVAQTTLTLISSHQVLAASIA